MKQHRPSTKDRAKSRIAATKVPPELYEDVRILSYKARMTITEVIVAALEAYMPKLKKIVERQEAVRRKAEQANDAA